MDIAHKFIQIFGQPAKFETCAPGRVNLLGEHVDYNQGVVLPAAIDRAVYLMATPTSDENVTLAALDMGQQVSFRLSEVEKRCDIDGKPLPGWSHYPAGVAWVLQEAGLEITGMQVVYHSDVPIGSGLSSSAAVEVAFASTWQAISSWQVGQMELAQMCQKAENQYVGVSSGLMDQFASVCGVEGHVLCFDTRSLEWSAFRMPPGTAIVIADSGMRRNLASSAYNDRRAACERAVQQLQKYLPDIQSLRDVSTVELAAYAPYLPTEVAKRAEHVVKEIHRVDQAIIALRKGDARMFGGFMYASHKSLRDLYEVSVPELDSLVDIARGLPGIYGARLTGAGFGGCTVNLVDEKEISSFVRGLHDEYLHRIGFDITIYQCRASSGASAKRIQEL